MSLFKRNDAEVVRAIDTGSIPSEDLASHDGDSRVCHVRGRNFRRVDERVAGRPQTACRSSEPLELALREGWIGLSTRNSD